ncbi:MAG TPA: RNA methyltransferase [Burkholderiaceae bacterium]|jgi:TrmH family RNA methyltransferase
MKSITSRDNALYKELKHLAGNAQARRKEGRTLLDGVHLCETYLQHAGMPAMCVVGENALMHHEVLPIIAQCEDAGASCISLPDALFGALSQVENGVNLLFLIETPVAQSVPKLNANAVLLDNVQDPGNLGSILRSAAAAGVVHVYCSTGCVFAWSPKVLRAGMGAQFLLEIHENVDLATLIESGAVPVLATSSHATHTIYQQDLRQPSAWLFGHEGQGVAPELLALATHQVAIPHRGQVESLNVAASAAVCLFEQMRQQTS